MIPQTVEGYPVRAAYRVGETSEQYYVIAEKGERFVVWRVNVHADEVEAYWGHYDLTWEHASELFAKQCGLVPTPQPVWVTMIEYRHDADTYVRVHRSKLSAREAVEAYVKDWWDRELPDFEMPDNLEARVDEYFERTDESYMITKATIEE